MCHSITERSLLPAHFFYFQNRFKVFFFFFRITAVSYEAKCRGISRDSTPTVSTARQVYRDLIIIHPPTTPGSEQTDDVQLKIASCKIRAAITTVLESLTPRPVFQYASPDESYVDLTRYVNRMEDTLGLRGLLRNINANLCWENTFHYDGFSDHDKPSRDHIYSRLSQLRRSYQLEENERQEIRLLFGSTIASRIIQEVLSQTGYQSSVGIASNKRIAKIGSGLHKPGSATILAPSSLNQFSQFVKIQDISGLGGALGEAIMETFDIRTILELQGIRHKNLAFCELPSGQRIGYEKAEKVLNWAYGLCEDGVVPERFCKSATTSKKCYGKLKFI